ncbi:MAG: ankyrin repeat domain-containing protein, partial [Planctomycetes bacterium]|nr:ankyrin repeat domain-containing protein [Planctomycetota bacterium]
QAGETALNRAAHWGHPEMIEVLLSAGADINARARFDTTPVHFAVRQSDPAIVRLLATRGANVDAMDEFGVTPLHDAARAGEVGLTKALLSAGADVDAADHYGSTPLHLAARTGNASTIEALLESGADATMTTSTGQATPLHLAVAAGSERAAVALLEHGADVDVRESEWGQTPLMFASAYGRLDAVKALLRHGADPAVTTRIVDIPARAGVDDAAGDVRDKILSDFRSQHGAGNLNWRPTSEQVRTAVRAAQEVQRTLGDAEEQQDEFDPQSEEFRGYTGLVGTQGGLTALLHATREGQVEAAMALLDGGADINQVSAVDGTSPLLIATINGHFDLAMLFLEMGADPRLASAAGATPLYGALNMHWAPKARHPQPTDYMQQAVAWVEQVDRHFRDGSSGGYFFTADDTDDVITRTKSAIDNAVPSGNGTMAEVLARLFYLTGEDRYRTQAEATIAAFTGELNRNYLPYSTLLNAAGLLLGALQVVVAGDRGDGVEPLLAPVYGASLPNRVLQVVGPGQSLPEGHPARGKGMIDGAPAVYLCEGQVCSPPITDPVTLAMELAKL